MKSPRIESISKEVVFLALKDSSFPTKEGIELSKFRDNIADIREHIINSVPLPDHYYRQSSGRDYLLEERGWLHLHVGHDIDGDVLLIVEQTADKVIFIALTDHTIFRETPRAKSILGLGPRPRKQSSDPARRLWIPDSRVPGPPGQSARDGVQGSGKHSIFSA